ncbi:MAG: aldo/keto reductase [Actinomycetota bacterium]
MSVPTRRLGTSDLELTVIGYGAWEASEHWGTVDEDGIVATITSALDSGINWIDTAEVYGPHTSERLVGRAIKDRPDVIVATKVAPSPAGSGFSKDDVRRACEASLKRLGRDVIDLYQLHWPDSTIPIEETWESMSLLASEGLIRACGVSNFSQSLIERCEAIRHVDSLQPQASMLHRDNLDLIERCGRNGTGTVAYSPLACGLLTGAITKDTKFEDSDWRSGSRGFTMYEDLFGARFQQNLETVDRLRSVSDKLGITLGDLAIAWVLDQPGTTSAIVGSRNPKHVADNVRAASITLSDEDRRLIAASLG